MRPQPCGQLAQDAMHFARFRQLQFAQPVHQLERDRWLDEQRVARRRLVVHQAAHLAATIPADGYHITTFADRDRRVRDLVPRRQTRHVLLEFLDDPAACTADLAPERIQLT
jgi:hypothetical protein